MTLSLRGKKKQGDDMWPSYRTAAGLRQYFPKRTDLSGYSQPELGGAVLKSTSAKDFGFSNSGK
jgi:hypothetical protein